MHPSPGWVQFLVDELRELKYEKTAQKKWEKLGVKIKKVQLGLIRFMLIALFKYPRAIYQQ